MGVFDNAIFSSGSNLFAEAPYTSPVFTKGMGTLFSEGAKASKYIKPLNIIRPVSGPLAVASVLQPIAERHAQRMQTGNYSYDPSGVRTNRAIDTSNAPWNYQGSIQGGKPSEFSALQFNAVNPYTGKPIDQTRTAPKYATVPEQPKKASSEPAENAATELPKPETPKEPALETKPQSLELAKEGADKYKIPEKGAPLPQVKYNPITTNSTRAAELGTRPSTLEEELTGLTNGRAPTGFLDALWLTGMAKSGMARDAAQQKLETEFNLEKARQAQAEEERNAKVQEMNNMGIRDYAKLNAELSKVPDEKALNEAQIANQIAQANAHANDNKVPLTNAEIKLREAQIGKENAQNEWYKAKAALQTPEYQKEITKLKHSASNGNYNSAVLLMRSYENELKMAVSKEEKEKAMKKIQEIRNRMTPENMATRGALDTSSLNDTEEK